MGPLQPILRLLRTLALAAILAIATHVVWRAASAVAGDEMKLDESIVAGRKILADNSCNGACHQARAAGGNPLTLYTRETRRVNSVEELRRQVEMCVSLLSAPVFPEDIEVVVKTLDHDFYHFD